MQSLAIPRPRRAKLRRWKNDLLFYGAMGLFALLGRLPAPLMRALGWGLGALAAGFASRERRRAWANLRASDLEFTLVQRSRLLGAVFAELGRRLADWVALVGGRGRQALLASVRFAPGAQQSLAQAVARGRGVVLASAHQGDWELLAAALARVAPLSVLGRSSYDSRFTHLIVAARRRFGVETLLVETPNHLRRALERLRCGEQVGVLLDLPVGAQRIAFLGRTARVATTAAGLARASGAALVVAWIERQQGGHLIRLREQPLEGGLGRAKTLSRATAAAHRRLEGAIRQHPAQWLWTLDRWRP